MRILRVFKQAYLNSLFEIQKIRMISNLNNIKKPK